MRYNLNAMNAYLGHLSNHIQGSLVLTGACSTLGDARVTGRCMPCHLPRRTSAVYLPSGTVNWPCQQAKAQSRAVGGTVRACIADRAFSELTAPYQHHTASAAEFAAAAWSVSGYEPESSPEEEVCGGT